MPRRNFIMQPNHNTHVPRNMVWVDTEAVNENGIPADGRQTLNFGVAIAQIWRDETNLEREEKIRFEDARTFWEWVEQFCWEGRACWVMAHNWNYDAGILNTSVLLPELGWECSKYINGKPPLIVQWRKDKKGLTMVDTLNYFKQSVKSLGEAVGLEKLDMPEGTDKEEWNRYAWRDVEIIRDAFLALRDFVVVNDLGTMQPTLASQGLSSFRHKFMHSTIKIHNNDKANQLERASYHGGRTESFFRGKTSETLYKLDINSMYPSIMATHPLPCELLAYFPSFKQDWWNRAHTDNNSIVASVTIETDEPCYGFVESKNKRLIFPTGRFSTTLSTPEIQYAEQQGHIQKIHSFAMYKREILFDTYVNYFYHTRQEYREQGNDVFSYMCKILMNSLYGKFGQNGRKWVQTDEYTWESNTPGLYQATKDSKPVYLRRRLGHTEILLTDSESAQSFPLIAAEITAYARMQLWDLIKQAGEFHVYYVDTDSLIVDETGYANLASEIHSTDLGKLKLEGTSKDSLFLAPKHYTFDGEIKIKGIRKQAIQNPDGSFTQSRFSSWDAIIGSGNDGYIDVLPVTKNVSGENTKRLYDTDGWTLPIHIWER